MHCHFRSAGVGFRNLTEREDCRKKLCDAQVINKTLWKKFALANHPDKKPSEKDKKIYVTVSDCWHDWLIDDHMRSWKTDKPSVDCDIKSYQATDDKEDDKDDDDWNEEAYQEAMNENSRRKTPYVNMPLHEMFETADFSWYYNEQFEKMADTFPVFKQNKFLQSLLEEILADVGLNLEHHKDAHKIWSAAISYVSKTWNFKEIQQFRSLLESELNYYLTEFKKGSWASQFVRFMHPRMEKVVIEWAASHLRPYKIPKNKQHHQQSSSSSSHHNKSSYRWSPSRAAPHNPTTMPLNYQWNPSRAAPFHKHPPLKLRPSPKKKKSSSLPHRLMPPSSHQKPKPHGQKRKIIIDLVSSSDDENEDDDLPITQLIRKKQRIAGHCTCRCF